jgi:hypothetical protein
MPPQAEWPLKRLAERIARNREVLGLHFPSDSAAGLSLANSAFAKLTLGPKYLAIKSKAVLEWQ